MVEYWFYYVHNRYRIRGNLLPIWVDGSHPNDLEHVHSSCGAVTTTWGSRPPRCTPAPMRGRCRSTGTAIEPTRRCPDGCWWSWARMQWHRTSTRTDCSRPGPTEIRATRWCGGFATVGSRGHVTALCTWEREALAPPCSSTEAMRERRNNCHIDSYRRRSLGGVQRAHLTDRQRTDIFETNRNWFRRLFGGDNGSSSTLLVPPVRDQRSRSIGVDRSLPPNVGCSSGPS